MRAGGEAENHKSYRGYLYIAAATFCWGVSATLGRAAFTGRIFQSGSLTSIDPLILSQSRITFAFLIFLPSLLLGRGWRRLAVPAADFARMFVVGVLGVAGSNYFYYLAVQRTNVATAITVQYTAPIWVLLYMVAAGLQGVTVRRLLAVVLAITGIILVVGLFTPGAARLDLIGVTAALLAALAFAFYNVGGHELVGRYDHWLLLLYITFSGSVFWIAINPPWKILARHYSGPQWTFLFIFSVVSVLAPFSLYIAGLRYLDPTRAVVVSCLEPVFSVAIAGVVLGEGIHLLQGIGILLVLAAILVTQIPDRKSDRMILIEPIE